MSPRVVLVGPPGAGKSTVGRLLAARLETAFLDSDSEIQRETGSSIPEIFAAEGEQGFRRIESAVVARLVMTFDGVLSLGGGAVTDSGTRALLQGQRVVWLDISADLAFRRVGRGKGRPLLKGMGRQGMADLLAAREGWYREVATWRVETSTGSPDRVVEVIEELLDAS